MAKSLMLAAILGQIVFFNSICLVIGVGLDEDEIFRKYRPLAMDESLEVPRNLTDGDKPDKVTLKTQASEVDSGIPLSSGLNLPPGLEDLDTGISDIGLPDTETLTSFDNHGGISNKNPRHFPLLSELEDAKHINASELMFRIPKSETPLLTRIITGKEPPVLVHDDIVKPVIENNPKSKVLATYKILVPIYIPAVKASHKISPVQPRAPVKYVKEVHTEMVPVKKSVSRVKNVIKAERVPQQIITDYVKADGTSVPSSIDDKLKPNEKVLKSVVTNYD